MINKRAVFANSLDKMGILNLLSKLSRPMLIVFNYHRLYRGQIKTEYDEGVFGHSEDTFIQQLRWLQKHFDLIGEASLIDSIKNGRAFKRRTAMLTFDDGYLDNYELAYPILSDLNIHAIFFVSCNQVDGKVSM